MPIKKKTDLKFVVDDLSMLLVQETPITVSGHAITINPEYELPVTVDTLQTTGGEPTINHYKVIGLDSDWTSSSTPGEWTVQFTVPTLHTDVLGFAFGSQNVDTQITATTSAIEGSGGVLPAAATTPYAAGSLASGFEGVSVGLVTNKITCSLVIVNGAKDKMVVFRNVDLWAHIMKEANGDPYCVQFNGTVVSDGTDDMMVLHRSVNASASS